jgi:hypothetical protein
MRSKPVAVILALTLGILGIHRLYLGQYMRAILYLTYPVALITAFFYFTGTLHIVREQLILERSAGALYFLLPFLIVPFFDAIWLGMMNRAKFFDRYNTTIGTTWGRIWRSIVTLAAGTGIALGLYQMFFIVKPVDVSKEADYKLSARELVEAFAGNADSSMQIFEGRLIEVSGTVVDEEWMMAEGDDLRSLLLDGAGQTRVKCRFLPSQREQVVVVQNGTYITVKGILEDASDFEVILSNCILLQVP